jgi:hypothetical protein
MKTLMLIATALMISTPVFAAPLPKDAVIIKLPRIEVIGKRHDAIDKKPIELAVCDTPLGKNAVIVKLPRIEVIGKRQQAINHLPAEITHTRLAKNAVIIKLPRIEVIAKRNSLPVPLSMVLAAEQGDGVFMSVIPPSVALVRKINVFMPYGV